MESLTPGEFKREATTVCETGAPGDPLEAQEEAADRLQELAKEAPEAIRARAERLAGYKADEVEAFASGLASDDPEAKLDVVGEIARIRLPLIRLAKELHLPACASAG